MNRWAAAFFALCISVGCALAQSNSPISGLSSATPLTGAEIGYCLQGGSSDTKCTTQAVADANAINPLAGYNAAGSKATTTGTISASSKSLTVASATGWSVGMGIAVANAGTGGNTELISKVTAIVGTTFTLNDAAITTATNQTVNHDDTAAFAAAITAAISANRPLHCQTGDYNFTSGQTVSSPLFFNGDGDTACIIWNRSKTATVFTLNYGSSVPFSGPVPVSALFHNFGINQASGVTPTAGGAFSVSGSGANYLSGLRVENLAMNGLWGGIAVGSQAISNWFVNLRMVNFVGGWGIDYNSPPPAGDNHWINIEMSGLTTGVRITASDTQEFTGLKTNQSGVLFNGASNTAINRVRFVNPSIEGTGSGSPTTPACAIDFGANGANQITIAGGEIAGITTPLCNSGNVVGGLNVDGVVQTDAGFTANGVLNVKKGLPTSCSGQISGTLWNNTSVLNICP